jgi:hypothetical protein
VLELGTPSLSWRRLGRLIGQMPPESRVRFADDPERYGWDVHAYLQAAQIDAVNGAAWQQAAMWSEKGRKPPLPAPTWRPQAPGTPRKKTWEEKVQAFAEMKQQRDRELEAMANGS